MNLIEKSAFNYQADGSGIGEPGYPEKPGYADIHGLIAPMFTPVKLENRKIVIDELATYRLTADLIVGGSDSIFVLGHAGMFEYLDLDQKETLIRNVALALALSQNRHPNLLVGVTDNDIESSLILADIARNNGAKAIVFIPSYNPGDPRQHLLDLLNGSSLPVILYNNPGIQQEGKSLRMELIREFAGHPRVIGIKNSNPAINYHLQLIELQKPGFRVFVGHTPNILPLYAQAEAEKIQRPDGIVPVQANYNATYYAGFIRNEINQKYNKDYIEKDSSKSIEMVMELMIAQNRLDIATLHMFQRSISNLHP
jgi:dihydrodipicolinate synthase/N-acetylneuraminate lyase